MIKKVPFSLVIQKQSEIIERETIMEVIIIRNYEIYCVYLYKIPIEKQTEATMNYGKNSRSKK